jgi:two-component system, cell cycle sensor histidine kinase and response regulator CckA
MGEHQPIAAPLELWIVAAEQSFVGPAPSTPALRAAVIALAQRAARSGEVTAQDVEDLSDTDEPLRAVRLTARPVAEGTVAVAGLGLDRLREAENALSRYEMVMRASRDAMWEWNVARRRQWWNRQQYQMLGYDPGSTVASYEAWMARIHPDDRPRVERHIEEAVAGGGTLWQDEYRFLRGDGKVHVALDRGYIERDRSGQLLRMVGVMSDITAEREALAGLRSSEERFREITAATIDQVFWLSNHDGSKTEYVSPAYETVWGRSCESLYRDASTFLDAIHEDDRARIEACLPRQREGLYDEVYRIRRPDGSIAWIRDRAFPIRDATGEVVRVVGVATDITGQRQLEQQLAQAQRMESIGRLAGGVAHDFNNLLTVILPSVQMALAKLPPGSSVQGELDAIEDAADRAARLTAQLLAFARRQVVAPARLELNELARHMEQLLRRVIGEDIELTTVLAAEPDAVVADRSQLEQVLVNLAINARDAMPHGGRLSIATRTVSVDRQQAGGVRVKEADHVEPGEYVVLAVSDTGVGIPNHALPHVFEPFFTTKPAGRGTGLGLSTCYGIVHQAGGVISVDTAVGRGTTFTIMLPRAREHARAVERRPRARAARGNETVLYVEDEPAVRKVGVAILSDEHYRVLEAAGGPEALQLAASYDGLIHLLITDVVMPRMSGTELARRLIARRPELRVLYTSGYTEDAVVHQGVLDPKTAFLQKPFAVEVLLRKVRELLDADG